jgi:uncharacterized membrane protein
MLRALLIALPLGAAACGGGSSTNADGGALHCAVDAPTSCPPDGAPTWETIQPVIVRRCVPCHNGQEADGPWPLLTYEEVVSWSDDVRTMVLECTMPPPGEGIITDEERHAILQWLRCDYPR